ncbi:MAG: helix-turn-helix transcriptional regulator [Ruminococcaceae bacterium]|nr:helix-turn-helix transcriptional regulator [Oscillospiraceae bacterium]
MNLGEKIKSLRKEKNISQETLANHLGLSFQAVSKWETGVTMPDVSMIPAIAYYFGISTDELFDYSRYETEKNVEAIVDEYSKYWGKSERPENPKMCEKVLREGLKKYPGNDILLNCLICVLPVPERAAEVIEIAKALIASTKIDEVRLDSYRILAETYKATGEYTLCKDAIEHIPEIYFTKLYTAADLLEGEEGFMAAAKERSLAFEHLIYMLYKMAEYYVNTGEKGKAEKMYGEAKAVIEAMNGDYPTKWTRSLEDREEIVKIEEKLKNLIN